MLLLYIYLRKKKYNKFSLAIQVVKGLLQGTAFCINSGYCLHTTVVASKNCGKKYFYFYFNLFLFLLCKIYYISAMVYKNKTLFFTLNYWLVGMQVDCFVCWFVCLIVCCSLINLLSVSKCLVWFNYFLAATFLTSNCHHLLQRILYFTVTFHMTVICMYVCMYI